MTIGRKYRDHISGGYHEPRDEVAAADDEVGRRWRALKDAAKKKIPRRDDEPAVRDLSKTSPMGVRG